MAIFNSLDDFYNQLQADVEDISRTSVVDAMKEEMVKGIELEVYSRYNPSQYIRRESNGGLIDKSNMVANIRVDGSKIYIDMDNITKGAGSHSYKRIDDIIVSGTGYTWKRSKIYKAQPYPRDFYEKTQSIIDQDGKLLNVVLSQLKVKYDIN